MDDNRTDREFLSLVSDLKIAYNQTGKTEYYGGRVKIDTTWDEEYRIGMIGVDPHQALKIGLEMVQTNGDMMESYPCPSYRYLDTNIQTINHITEQGEMMTGFLADSCDIEKSALIISAVLYYHWILAKYHGVKTGIVTGVFFRLYTDKEWIDRVTQKLFNFYRSNTYAFAVCKYHHSGHPCVLPVEVFKDVDKMTLNELCEKIKENLDKLDTSKFTSFADLENIQDYDGDSLSQ